jgi:hypothetical protein
MKAALSAVHFKGVPEYEYDINARQQWQGGQKSRR